MVCQRYAMNVTSLSTTLTDIAFTLLAMIQEHPHYIADFGNRITVMMNYVEL
jgi:hypothetical protein